jgi:hypothetical protein
MEGEKPNYPYPRYGKIRYPDLMPLQPPLFKIKYRDLKM